MTGQGLDLFFVPRRDQLTGEDVVLDAFDNVEQDDQNGQVLDPGPFERVPESRGEFDESLDVPDVNAESERRLRSWRRKNWREVLVAHFR